MSRRSPKSNRAQRALIEAIEPRVLLTTYYVSPGGNDGAAGTSPAAAFKTAAKINTLDLNAGDSVLFEGGQTFPPANLTFDASDSGTAANPVTIGSYGVGRATLNGGSSSAIVGTNTAGFVVHDLIVTGAWNAAAGSGPTNGNGILFWNTNTSGPKLSYLRVDNVDVSGYRSQGIYVTCGSAKIGYDDVRISNTLAHDNGAAGIIVDGWFDAASSAYAHSNVDVEWCKAYNNYGIPTATSHTGSGIILADINGGSIERCVAWNNGQLCNSTAGGPVGIWAWDANNITIQFNESYSNKTGSPSKDGGGFDLDGGVTNSFMQYNYSHDNAGAGYLIYQFAGARAYGNNIVRYNISQNDGRAHAYSGIYIGGGSQVVNNQIYANSIYITPTSNSNIAAVIVDGVGTGNTFRNNSFYTTSGVRLVDNNANSPTSNILFQGNDYYSGGGTFAIRWGASSYSSLTNWRNATLQEQNAAGLTGLSVNPQLVNAGGGGTIGDAALLHTLVAYQLLSGSPLINAGVTISGAGGRDYNGNAVPTEVFDIGAFESTPSYTATGGNDVMTLRRLGNGNTELLVNSTTPTLVWASGVFPTYTINGNGGDDTLTITGGSGFAINAANVPGVEHLAVESGTYALASSLTLATIDVANSATLDLSTQTLTATAGPLGSWNGSAYTGVTGLVQAHRITAAPGVGVALISGNVVVRRANAGDANLDGVIDGDDFFAIDANAGLVGGSVSYAKGDFDYNGRVDADDFFLIDSNYNNAALARSAPVDATYSSPTISSARGLAATPIDAASPTTQESSEVRRVAWRASAEPFVTAGRASTWATFFDDVGETSGVMAIV